MASIKCKDEKVYQLLQRVIHGTNQEDYLAYLGEASELRHSGYGYNSRSGSGPVGSRLLVPASDDRYLHSVIVQ